MTVSRWLAGSRVLTVMLAAIVLALLVGRWAPGAAAQDAPAFPALKADQHIYDETGSSLTADQIAAIEQQVAEVEATGAHVVVLVRNLMATPDETLDQVEALQRAWVAATGVEQKTAVAILINRNPDDSHDARAGIFVGKTYNDGNVPDGEQRAIVDDELIPPLRDGNVFDSVSGALGRLQSSIVNGPPQSSFEKWSRKIADSWVPWLTGGLGLLGAAGAYSRFSSRRSSARPALPLATQRPGNLTPALAGALVAGGAQPSAIPATILDLAARGALAIEPEAEGGLLRKPSIAVRLVDRRLVTDRAEDAVWEELEKRATMGLVSSKELKSVAISSGKTKDVLKDRLQAEGWLDNGYYRRVGLAVLALLLVGSVLGVSIGVAAAASAWQPLVAIGGMMLAGAGVLAVWGGDSPLSPAGKEAAAPWKAYKEGLKEAAENPNLDLDLNSALADSIAFNLGSKLDKRLEEAEKSGVALQAFTSTVGGSQGHPGFLYWTAFNSTMVTSSGSTSAGTVSGGGAGGGGGAAGST